MSTLDEATFATNPTLALRAARSGEEVVIEASDGAQYSVTMRRGPDGVERSPLDVGTVPGMHLTVDQILDAIRAGHERR